MVLARANAIATIDASGATATKTVAHTGRVFDTSRFRYSSTTGAGAHSEHSVTSDPCSHSIEIRERHCLQYVIPTSRLSARSGADLRYLCGGGAMKPQRGVVGWVLLFWILGVPLSVILLILLILAILD